MKMGPSGPIHIGSYLTHFMHRDIFPNWWDNSSCQGYRTVTWNIRAQMATVRAIRGSHFIQSRFFSESIDSFTENIQGAL
jgi:hypothetical protein